MNVALAGFVGGILGSAHCLGMCGAFAAALGSSGGPLWPALRRQLVYHSGRAVTYTFLGAAGGFAGTFLSAHRGGLITVQQIFSILAGVVMLWVGMSLLGLIRQMPAPLSGIGRVIADMFRQCLNARGGMGLFGAGMANGFLPCGLVYAFLAMAVAGGRMFDGMVLMAAFGLGTMPALVLLGCGSRWIGEHARRHVLRVAACLVIMMGVVTIVRAIPAQEGGCCEHSSNRAAAPNPAVSPAADFFTSTPFDVTFLIVG